MLLFVGLGNPGSRYVGNRHNIGFMAVEEIARLYKAPPWRRRFQGAVTEANIGSEKVLFLLPETFMNESGRAVQEAMQFYKIALKDVVVFHDELDLPPAKMRVSLAAAMPGIMACVQLRLNVAMSIAAFDWVSAIRVIKMPCMASC